MLKMPLYELLVYRLCLRLQHFSSISTRSHRFAALRAFPAGAHAFVHISYLFAAIGAGCANVGANCAYHRVHGRLAEHEIGRSLTDFGTVDHQPIMIGLDMFTAFFKAMRHRHFQTGVMTTFTCSNTVFHRGIFGLRSSHIECLQLQSAGNCGSAIRHRRTSGPRQQYYLSLARKKTINDFGSEP